MINKFEKLLAVENQTTILKFFLHISREEQLARFEQRLNDPARQWKISESDYQERGYWDDYMAAFEDVFHETSTDHAPWFVVPADHKWFRDLAISQIITNTLENLDMKPPKPTVDLADIKRKYHTAVAEAKTPTKNIPG
jgi:polyphosphate kinase 2 (PPK2 family)